MARRKKHSRLKQHQNEKKSIEISFIPVINVVFLLLIFFMVQGNLSENEEPLENAPKAKTTAIAEKDYLAISLNKGQVFMQNQAYSLDALQTKLKSLSKVDKQNILLKVMGKENAQLMVETIEAVKLSGIEEISIATIGIEE